MNSSYLTAALEMAKSLLVVLAIGTLLAVGCTSKTDEAPWSALERADQFELLSIDPGIMDEEPKDEFHGRRVLGRTQVKDADLRKQLVAALKKGSAESHGGGADCFFPRHGIRATREGKTTDFVICFECLQVEIYVEDQRHGGFSTSNSPQPVFDRALRDADVPLAESAAR